MRLHPKKICFLFLIFICLPVISFAESNFLKALNKTINRVNGARYERIHQQANVKHQEFWNNAKTALSTSELELLKSDLKTTHENTRAEVEEKYRETFAAKALKPLTPEEKEQMIALRDISSVVLRRSTNDLLKGSESVSVKAAPVSTDGKVITKKNDKKLSNDKESENEILADNKETIHTHAHDERGQYVISKDLGADQLLLEKAIDYQDSPFANDPEDREETELFKRISKAYQKKYRVFSKRIESNNK